MILLAIGFLVGALVESILTQMENNRARNKPRPLLVFKYKSGLIEVREEKGEILFQLNEEQAKVLIRLLQDAICKKDAVVQ